jgi:hypothetical protein
VAADGLDQDGGSVAAAGEAGFTHEKPEAEQDRRL